VKEHKEKREEKKRMSKKYNKRKPFGQVGMTLGPILA